MTDTRLVDCLIVGGGPGGLTAAVYLARFNRAVAVVDAGKSRLREIPLSRNMPGFPDGVSGKDLLARMRSHATRSGAELFSGQVTDCVKEGHLFDVTTSAGRFRAKTVLLATGVDVTAPDMHGLDDAIARGLIRYCPICDGSEARNARIAVLGARPGSIDEARFLLTYSRDVTFVQMKGGASISDDQRERATKAGVAIETSNCVSLSIHDDMMELVLATGERRLFDVVYPCLGSRPRSELAASLGSQLSEQAELITDPHQATDVNGLYAVGDVLLGLDQVATACGQAAIAATAIHNLLRERES